MKKLFIVVNEDRFFLSHRKAIGIEAKRQGYDVTVITKDLGNLQKIKDLGLKTMDLPINPLGMNLKEEFKTLRFLYRLYQQDRPDIVHHVGLKNILWGGLAARAAPVPGVVNAVSGLGSLFNDGQVTLMTRLILAVMRFSNARKGVKIIFQNDDDLDMFLKYKVIKPSQAEYTKGSGIDLNEYSFTPAPTTEPINILFTARMVKEKGVVDLIEAAKILHPQLKDRARFLLCGRLTLNKNAVSKEYLEQNCDGKYICYLGERSDVKELLCSSHIMVFPSYYREGVPKSLIEASAIGRPIITCNSIGCKDVVTDGVNGLLIDPRNPKMLAEKIMQLVNDPELRQKMGVELRKIAEKEFSINKVVDTHLKIYNSF